MNPFSVLRAVVAEVYNVEQFALLGNDVTQRVAVPRQALCFAGKTLIGLSWSDMGRYLGRDHTTVSYAHEKHARRLEAVAAERTRMGNITREFCKRMVEIQANTAREHKPIRWTEERIAHLADLRRKGTSLKQCAEILGLDERQIKGAINRFGLGSRRHVEAAKKSSVTRARKQPRRSDYGFNPAQAQQVDALFGGRSFADANVPAEPALDISPPPTLAATQASS